MTSGSRVLAAIVLSLLGAVRAGAQVDLPCALGQPIVSQSLTIEGRPATDVMLLDLLQTTVGTPLTTTAVRETIAHFVGLGHFEDVVASAAPVAGGVALTYDLVPARAVRRIEFRGDVAISERTLRNAIEEQFGEAFPLARLADLEAVHRRHRQGPRLSAAAGHAAARDRRSRRSRQPRRRGRGGTSRDNLGRGGGGECADPAPEHPWSPGPVGGTHYRKSDVDRKLERLVADLRKDGYYEARADHQLRTGTRLDAAELVVNVDGGARIEVVFEGDPLSAKEQRDLRANRT